jgi:hypothetical protein
VITPAGVPATNAHPRGSSVAESSLVQSSKEEFIKRFVPLQLRSLFRFKSVRFVVLKTKGVPIYLNLL